LSYNNSFEASWHFDDYGNIVENANIQIKQLTWDNFKKLSYGIMNEGRISRPFSYFSFALNYYFGGLDVFGYHVANFFIHYFSAVFLFLFIFNTLKLPIIKKEYEKHAYSIALLATLFWAINPVQVTAVTYIVQRMASMVALFYIMGMYFYLKFRTSLRPAMSVVFILLCVLCAFLAIGTKENAVMLPVSILLYDIFFIQGISKETIKKNAKIIIIPAVIIVTGFMISYDFSSIIKDYEFRPFTIKERLLTEPRVILFYLSLLFYPLTSRLTLIHDIEISKSLLDPWTTLAAIITIALIITICLIKAKKWPLITYCLLFFFLNHFIEGSFLSLELIFEHRNYLPSMLLFIPFAILLVKGLEYFYQKKTVFYFLAGTITFLMIVLSISVYIQNDIMRDELSLWSDNVEKSPRLHHPRQGYAVALFIMGRLPESIIELKKAEKSYESALITKKGVTYGCIGEYYYLTGDYEKSLEYYKKSIDWYPSMSYVPLSYYRVGLLLMKKGLLDEAEQMFQKAISLKPQEPGFYLTYSEILIKKKQPDEAIKKAQIVLRLNPDSLAAYRYIADAYALKKDKAAEDHFRAIGKGANRGNK
jgi:tetratricopeptide (TPR) repeat protein